ncbi:lytic polysaccharide monooxygenase [Pseudomonas fluorescens]|uniref:GlcNAc-binding protein A n=1 Tax=Pseudomonas fluorescens TaxID=294 RepID=A0A5E7C5L1_PSEFL|nr:lytic polysaccharide monooxygenase [Pseudomonas fluorescens]VVN99809.1 GlcNAc-binding protein A [Pseudomonas fluorescens]
MSQIRRNTISRSNAPRHGHIFYPASRAYFAWLEGWLDEGALNQRESGKFFPLTAGNVRDFYAKDDDANVAPPPDGKIASANQLTGAKLDEPGDHWQKHDVRSCETLDVSWNFTAKHVTRRYNYFITKEKWDPSKVLSRDQFESQPFYTVQNNQQPHWRYTDEMLPTSPTTHEVPLPKREGYHVLLAVWEVANTSMAFYQVVDLNFLPPDGGGERPSTPTGLAAGNVTDKQVVLTWNAATGPTPIAFYRLTRNGITTFDIEAPLQSWTDNSVASETTYSYFISAIDVESNMSAPSRAIEVRTLAEGGEAPLPGAPKNLHSMSQTANSISLMWEKSVGAVPIVNYLIFRDDHEVRSVSGNQTSVDDTGLTPDTEYRYFVKALDLNGKLSLPSNTLKANTRGEGGLDPAWKLNMLYAKGDLVSYDEQNWRCIQAHTSHVEEWAPGVGDNVLWEKKS